MGKSEHGPSAARKRAADVSAKSERVCSSAVANDVRKTRKREVLSSLDTLGTTRPRAGDAWLDSLEDLTKEHREARAREHERRALAMERFARVSQGLPEREWRKAGDWHRSRAKGQRRRFTSVRECRRETMVCVVCEGCGTVNEQPGRCSVGVLCLSCRGRRAKKLRGNFCGSRDVILSRARSLGLLRAARRGGRWSEKLLTLTAPQLPHVKASARTLRVRAAWPRFVKQLNRWMRAHRAHIHSAWFRNLEWESGHDGEGHPHIHAWLFTPFLPRDMIIEWWGRALLRSGYTRAELGAFERANDGGEGFRLVVDIREASGRDVAFEVIKYLTKDIVSDGRRVAPEQYAHVVRDFDGARTTQSSRGFMSLGRFAPQCDCGSTSCYSVRIVHLSELVSLDVARTAEARAPPNSAIA